MKIIQSNFGTIKVIDPVVPDSRTTAQGTYGKFAAQIASGGRVKYRGAGLVDHGPAGVRQGYAGSTQGGEATALKHYKKDVAEFGEDALNEAAQLLEGKNYSELGGDKYYNTKYKIRKELREFDSVLGESESRKRSAKGAAKRQAKIKINLIEATQEGFFEPKKFAEKNNITLDQLKTEAKQLQRSIYIKRGILTGKKSPSTLEWLTSNDFKLDNTLKKLFQSKVIVFQRDRIADILYDAFGRKFEKGSTTKLNPTRDVEKYNVIKKNLHEFETLKKKDTKFTKYSKKIIKPTSEEMQLHRDFLKNELKKNFFIN